MNKKEVIKKYVIDEMSKFKDFNELKNFVNTLQDDQITHLAKQLSDWRKNSIYEYILNGPDKWSKKLVPISDICVTKVKDEMDSLFAKHNHELKRISEDKDICELSEFKNQGKIFDELKILIARKKENKFYIKDGIHRAVRLACNGKNEFELIYSEA